MSQRHWQEVGKQRAMLFGALRSDGWTYAAIGKRWGVTRSNIDQAIRRWCARMPVDTVFIESARSIALEPKPIPAPKPRDDLSDLLDQTLNEKAGYLHVYQDEGGGLNVIIDACLSHAQLAIIVKVLDDAKGKPC